MTLTTDNLSFHFHVAKCNSGDPPVTGTNPCYPVGLVYALWVMKPNSCWVGTGTEEDPYCAYLDSYASYLYKDATTTYLNPVAAMSFEMWFKLDDVSIDQTLVYYGKDSANWFMLEWYHARINCNIVYGGTTYMAAFKPTLVNNTWYHVVFTVNISPNAWTMYLNNVSQSVNTGGSCTRYQDVGLWFGINTYDGSPTQYLKGDFPLFRYYTKVLNSTEIGNNYAVGKAWPGNTQITASINASSTITMNASRIFTDITASPTNSSSLDATLTLIEAPLIDPIVSNIYETTAFVGNLCCFFSPGVMIDASSSIAANGVVFQFIISNFSTETLLAGDVDDIESGGTYDIISEIFAISEMVSLPIVYCLPISIISSFATLASEFTFYRSGYDWIKELICERGFYLAIIKSNGEELIRVRMHNANLRITQMGIIISYIIRGRDYNLPITLSGIQFFSEEVEGIAITSIIQFYQGSITLNHRSDKVRVSHEIEIPKT